MTRNLRKRLARALERGDVQPARGGEVGEGMRRRLDRALAGSGNLETPLPRLYTAEGLTSADSDRIARGEAPDAPVGRIAELPGKELETPQGSVFCRRWSVPLDELASVQDLDDAAGGGGVLAELLDNPDLASLDPHRALYLDTETTGLAGGTGTYVFLLGMGWVEGGAFVVEQLFLRDFSEEPALLHRAMELVDRFDVLVSFNGRRYDMPLLDTRRVLNRAEGSFLSPPHLDLLYPARLLYRGRFEDCRLQTLERELMGQVRHEDVPGSEIPGLYFDYLGNGVTGPLVPIFEHNFLDVVTLLTLTAHFLHLCLRPDLDPRALGGLGRLHERRGNREQARALLERAQERRAATYRDLRDLGYLYKRMGEFDRAQGIWETLIQRQEKAGSELAFDATPYVESAKHLEHRLQDFARALELANAALERVTVISGEGPGTALQKALDHRTRRLRRRLEENNGHGLTG